MYFGIRLDETTQREPRALSPRTPDGKTPSSLRIAGVYPLLPAPNKKEHHTIHIMPLSSEFDSRRNMLNFLPFNFTAVVVFLLSASHMHYLRPQYNRRTYPTALPPSVRERTADPRWVTQEDFLSHIAPPAPQLCLLHCLHWGVLKQLREGAGNCSFPRERMYSRNYVALSTASENACHPCHLLLDFLDGCTT